MSLYFPSRDEISTRNSTNTARARGIPYSLPPDFANADTDELVHKFEQRRDVDGVCRCYLCGVAVQDNSRWHLDHLYPLALGGAHVVENLEMACPKCNLTKGALTLETFLGADRAAEWRRTGWPPPFERLRHDPVGELFERDPRIAKKFARSPRVVPFMDARWGPVGALDDRIGAWLANWAEPYRAIPLTELAATGPLPGIGPLEQAWDVAMGVYTSPGNPGYVDHRYRPSPRIVASRAPDGSMVGARAFRLRFDVEIRRLRTGRERQ